MRHIYRVVLVITNIAFHMFLAAYWYLVHALYPELALFGAVASYLIFLWLNKQVDLSLPSPVLLLLTAIAFFLMLNPLPSLYGLSQLLWCAGSAIVFRLGFAKLPTSLSKLGALLVSYCLFLALPMGMPRMGPTEPSNVAGKPLDVAIVGAGFGGVAMGKELLDAGITNFRIYEAAPEVGGTWWHNRYPGLHVDVQSALYSFSFYPNPNWSKRWAPRDELLEYSISAANALGVRPFIQLNSWVQGVRFNEDSELWEIELNGQRQEAQHLVLATGGLHIPNTPSFAGAEDFEGISFHSARWQDDVDLTGKRIAIIGSGASAVQIIPEIAKVAEQVDMYQRTPNWVSPQDNREVSRLRQLVYEYVPLAYKLQRLRTHTMSEIGYRAVFPEDSTQRPRVEEALKGYIRATVEDEDLVEELIPDYEFGCKRPLVTQHFYPSLNRDNVDVITEGIDRLTRGGVLSRTGRERPYDVIIMATGYRVAQLPFPIQGRDQTTLEALWGEKPEAYQSMMVHGFPNFYLMSGPNSGVFGSIIVHIETAAGYMIQVIRQAGDSQLVEPKLLSQQVYNQAIQADLQKTVWAGSCESWYKLDDGHVIANHPHPISQIIYERSRPRWQDFEITKRKAAKGAQ
ncbi:MAG: NAD(P)/FAD-dependent oxidoreductase [Pseudomonadota bacterium]